MICLRKRFVIKWAVHMARIRASEIPIIPTGDTMRVNVKVNRSVYKKAKALKVDVHTFWRLCLQEAVAALESQNDRSDGSSVDESRKSILDDFNAFGDVAKKLTSGEKQNGSQAVLDRHGEES